MTQIEEFLFTENVAHAVTSFMLGEQRVTVSVAPWEQFHEFSTSEFLEVRITSIEIYTDDPNDLNLPWDIIGFDSYSRNDNRWQFVLHTAGVEYVWESLWPSILNL